MVRFSSYWLIYRKRSCMKSCFAMKYAAQKRVTIECTISWRVRSSFYEHLKFSESVLVGVMSKKPVAMMNIFVLVYCITTAKRGIPLIKWWRRQLSWWFGKYTRWYLYFFAKQRLPFEKRHFLNNVFQFYTFIQLAPIHINK